MPLNVIKKILLKTKLFNTLIMKYQKMCVMYIRPIIFLLTGIVYLYQPIHICRVEYFNLNKNLSE